MIETKKIKSTKELEDVISTITNLAADMEVDVDMVLALFRMGNQRIMPILRNDLKQRDIVALLSAISRRSACSSSWPENCSCINRFSFW